MRAWLKGGLWGLLIGIIYFLSFVITFLLGSSPTETTGRSATIGMISFILIVPFSIFAYFPAGMSPTFLFVKLFFPIILTFFILGSLVGWIIGKIKSKKIAHTNSSPSARTL